MENRRIKMTKKLLRDSVLELMEEKPLNKITIKDICDNADINRTTFYKYYGDQYALVKEAESEVLDKLGEFIKNLNTDSEKISIIETFLYYIKNNGHAYHVLLNNGTDFSFSYKLMNVTLDNLLAKDMDFSVADDKKVYVYNLIAMGVINTIDLWITNKFDIPVSELAMLLYNFTVGGMAAVIL